MTNIAIFASGKGSNAERIISYFKENGSTQKVVLIITDKEEAGVYRVAQNHSIPVFCGKTNKGLDWEYIQRELEKFKISWIVLAGFLRMIPVEIIVAYPKRMLNIHPSLLPLFGGKGMYGDNVHKAVIENGAKESGISIHFVSEEYDKGEIVFQKKCAIEENDNVESLRMKIRELEHTYYPMVIEKTIKEQIHP